MYKKRDIHNFHADIAMWWRGELLKQKQMSEQRLDGHEWSSSCPDDCLKIYLAIIIPSHHQHENTLNLRQTQNIFLLFDLRTSAPAQGRWPGKSRNLNQVIAHFFAQLFLPINI